MDVEGVGRDVNLRGEVECDRRELSMIVRLG